MRIIKNIFIFLTIIFFASCSSEKDSRISDQSAIELPEIAKGNGVVPEDHPFYKEVQENVQLFSLNEIDLFYKDKIANDNNHYQVNLKNEAIFLIFAKGLVANGNEHQKKYYLNELMDLKQSLPNINNFYSLLKSSDFLSVESKKNYADNFYKKSAAVIAKLDDKDLRQTIELSLNECHRAI